MLQDIPHWDTIVATLKGWFDCGKEPDVIVVSAEMRRGLNTYMSQPCFFTPLYPPHNYFLMARLTNVWTGNTLSVEDARDHPTVNLYSLPFQFIQRKDDSDARHEEPAAQTDDARALPDEDDEFDTCHNACNCACRCGCSCDDWYEGNH